MNLVQELSKQQCKAPENVPKFGIGDTVRVHFRIVEGDKERIQIFEGVVISRKGKESPNATFTVRRVVFNEGIERVFPLHSPRVEKVKIVRSGHVRRSKLYYLRERTGKAARVKAALYTDKKIKQVAPAASVPVGEEQPAPSEENTEASENTEKTEAVSETPVSTEK